MPSRSKVKTQNKGNSGPPSRGLDVGLTTTLRTKHYRHESKRGNQVPRRYVESTKEEEEEEGGGGGGGRGGRGG